MISPRVVECPTSSRGKELPWLQSEKEGIKGGGGGGKGKRMGPEEVNPCEKQ